VVTSKTARDKAGKAAKFLVKALNPALKGDAPPELPLISRVDPRVINERVFADMNEADLEPYDCIFLCDVDRPDQTEMRRLKYHLRRGGGVVFCCGPQMAKYLDRYNRLLYEDGRGVVGPVVVTESGKKTQKPALELVEVQRAPEDHYFAFNVSNAHFHEPPLKVFDSADGHFLLRMVSVREYVRVKVQPSAGITAVLTFQPKVGVAGKKVDKTLPVDDPVVLLWQPVLHPKKNETDSGNKGATAPTLYRGRVGLITTSVNRDWTIWPAMKSYLPMMQEVLRSAIAGRLREQSAVVGEPLEEFLQAVGQRDVRVFTPDRRTLEAQTQLTEEASVFRWADTDVSGLYRVTIGTEPREHLFAVNVPATTPGQRASESDFSKPRCDVQLLKAAYPGWRLQVVNDVAKVNPSADAAGEGNLPLEEGEQPKGKTGPYIAWYLLVAVLVLLLIEVVLAWHFGHYSTVAGSTSNPPAKGRLVPGLVGTVAGVLLVALGWVLIDARLTGDFLGFLPEGLHGYLEEKFDIPKAQDGESNAWKLESRSGLLEEDDPWLLGAIALAASALVIFIYLREGRTAATGYKLLLAGLRIFLILLTMAVLIPQLELHFERRDWPDLVIIIDTSGSMGVSDNYQDAGLREAAGRLTDKLTGHLKDRLPGQMKKIEERLEAANKNIQEQEAQRPGPGEEGRHEKRLRQLRDAADELARQLTYLQNLQAQIDKSTWRPSRLQLAWALITLEEPDWLKTLLTRQKMKVYVYHLDRSGQAVSVGEVTGQNEPQRHRELLEKIRELRAEATCSPLDRAVHKVLADFSTSSLGAVIMLTDGITVPGAESDTRVESKNRDKEEDPLAAAADSAAARGVPLFFVGMGDAQGLRDVRLVGLDAPDVSHVRDTIDFKVTVRGHRAMKVPVILYEKSADGTLTERDRKDANIKPRGQEVTVTLNHKPEEVGEKTYVVRLDVPKAKKRKNRPRADQLELQRKIQIDEVKLVKVLYIEGMPRYDYRYVKTLLEREAGEDKSNKTVDLKVVLLDADDDYAKQDKSALVDLPPNRQELFQYDMIILGDVDPQSAKIKDRLKEIADFVRERGGGFLMVAGPNFSPYAYRGTPIQAILPVKLPREAPGEEEEISAGFRPRLTMEGQHNPLFRFSNDEGENLKIWKGLPPIYWYARGLKTKPAGRVLAVHPDLAALDAPLRGGDEAAGKYPLVVHQPVGAGRSMFFGFDESWRWRLRDNEKYFNRFWKNSVDYLAHRRRDRIELRLNKQTPYVRGEKIRVTVRFPDNSQPPESVRVAWKRRPLVKEGQVPRADRTEVLKLTKAADSMDTYEGKIDRTREGKYHFELSAPEVKKGPAPNAECVVIPPEQEMERLSMNESAMISAARKTRGKFFTLATAGELLNSLPEGERVAMNSTRPPSLLWNHMGVFLLVLFLFGAEWLLRKRKHLL
jgi:hypothetical protein